MPETLLPYDVHGQSGPFILFAHGLLSSRAQWLPNLPAFAPQYRPVVVELLGHGRSPAPADPAVYSPSAYVEHFEQIRAALGAERWYLVGQSLGATLTLRYALDHPERVIAQVFTNSNSALRTAEEMAVRQPYLEQQAAELRAEGRVALERHRLNPTRARGLAPEVMAAFREDFARHDPNGIAMTELNTIPPSSLRSRVAHNTVPTLLVVGERESRFQDRRRYAEESFRHLRVHPIDVGHSVNLAAVDEFNEAVLGFFTEHPPSTPDLQL